jgi:hypothetical protein
MYMLLLDTTNKKKIFWCNIVIVLVLFLLIKAVMKVKKIAGLHLVEEVGYQMSSMMV